MNKKKTPWGDFLILGKIKSVEMKWNELVSKRKLGSSKIMAVVWGKWKAKRESKGINLY